MNQINVEIGNRLKEIRKNLKLPQHQFCKLFDVSQSNYCRLERGFVDITPINIKTLCERHQVSVEWLILGKGEKYKKTSYKTLEDKMNKEYPLIKKIEKIPIQTNKRHYIPKYLRNFLKEIAKFSQMDQCGLLLFAKSTLLKGILVKAIEEQIELRYVNFRPLPWANEKDIIIYQDLMKLDGQLPLINSVCDYFSYPIRSVLIIPINYNGKNIGSIILLTNCKPHHFTPVEIDLLKQASAHLTTVLEKMVRQTVIEETKKIFYLINNYYQLLKQDETQNKNPNIIADVLQKVFDLKSVYIMKKDIVRGNRWYMADINENNEIESTNGAFKDNDFDSMLEETKNNCPDFLDIPIKKNSSIIGKLFIDYWQRENDHLFKKEINTILQCSADALAQLMYS